MARLAEIEPLVSDGLIFSIEFIKRTNDEDRFMVARTGVKKGVTGRGLSFNPRTRNLLSVYDIRKRAFRFVSCERILWLKHHGRKIEFKERGEQIENPSHPRDAARPERASGSSKEDTDVDRQEEVQVEVD